MKKLIASLTLAALALAVASTTLTTGCSTPSSGNGTNAVTSVITDPTFIQDLTRSATIGYLVSSPANPTVRADIAAVASVLTSLIQTGTLSPTAVQAALQAANVTGPNQALYASLITTITDQYSKYAGSATVNGALNQNTQLSAALSAALSGITQGLAMTATSARKLQ